MQTIRDWGALKTEFINGHWITLSHFFSNKGIPNNSYSRSKTKGWRVTKKNYALQVTKRATEQLIEEEVQIRIRQAKIAKKMQEKGLAALDLLEPKDIDEARKLVNDGLIQEREALGISGKHKPASLTQVNVNFPKTNLDRLLEDLDYGGILKLLAEVRRVKSKQADLDTNTNKNQTA